MLRGQYGLPMATWTCTVGPAAAELASTLARPRRLRLGATGIASHQLSYLLGAFCTYGMSQRRRALFTCTSPSQERQRTMSCTFAVFIHLM